MDPLTFAIKQTLYATLFPDEPKKNVSLRHMWFTASAYKFSVMRYRRGYDDTRSLFIFLRHYADGTQRYDYADTHP